MLVDLLKRKLVGSGVCSCVVQVRGGLRKRVEHVRHAEDPVCGDGMLFQMVDEAADERLLSNKGFTFLTSIDKG